MDVYRDIDEQKLAKLCADKDKRAQEELYSRYATRLYALCRRYSDSRNEAQDLVHDSFLKALDKMGTFTYRGKGSLYAWISRIAINTAVANIQRYKFHFVRQNSSGLETIPEPTDEELNEIPQDTLLDFISGLSEAQRAVFNLYCIEEYSHREIAGLLKISEKGSASLLAKARRQLRKRINEYIKDKQ